jgi:hypothetical protein
MEDGGYVMMAYGVRGRVWTVPETRRGLGG